MRRTRYSAAMRHAAEATEASFQEEMRRLLVRRVPAGIALVLGNLALGAGLEWLSFPERGDELRVVYAACALLCAVYGLVTPRLPRHAILCTAVFTNAMALCECTYFILIGSGGEAYMVLLIGHLASLAILYPWGAFGQAVGSAAVPVGYAGMLYFGTASAMTLGQGVMALIAAVTFSVIGADFLDAQRRAAFLYALSLRRSAELRADLCALAVELNDEKSPRGALELLCQRGRMIFGAAWAVVFLAEDGRLTGTAAQAGSEVPADSLSALQAGAEWPPCRAAATGAVVVAPEVPAEAFGGCLPGVRSLLAIPFERGERSGGVLVLGDVGMALEPGADVVTEARMIGALATGATRSFELRAQLESANAAKDELLANASHDLRTPLNVILGYADLILEGAYGELPPAVRQVVERIVIRGQEQLHLVEDLLTVSRLTLGQLSVQIARVPLAPILSDMGHVAAELVQGRPVRVSVQAVEPGLCAHADAARLRQILGNLVGNAAKFTERGTIELRALAADGAVRIAVADTGPGIAPEDHERIFEPFLQVAPNGAAAGAGLGLSIAQRLARLMGGELTVESAVDSGATFWLTLPAGRDGGEI